MPFEKLMLVPESGMPSNLVPISETFVLTHCPTFAGMDSARDATGSIDIPMKAETIHRIAALIVLGLPSLNDNLA
jgi:hypothetical protein